MLKQEQIDFYHRNGYIGVEDVLTADEVADLRRVTDEFVEKSRALTEHTGVFDLEPSHSPAHPRVRRLKNPHMEHIVYDRALRHEKILDIVSQLIGDGLRFNGQKLNMKYAEYGSPVEWHQDWAFYPHTNDDLLAVGVSFDDMTKANGALMVIPGSHQGPTYNHHQNGEFVGAVTDPNFSSEGAVPVEVKAGGISIHHVRTVHGSAPNTSSTPRRLLLSQYCAIDAWPLAGIPDWETFNSFVLRGEPTNQPRIEALPVRMPLPHAARKGSIYEVQSLLENPVFAKKAS